MRQFIYLILLAIVSTIAAMIGSIIAAFTATDDPLSKSRPDAGKWSGSSEPASAIGTCGAIPDEIAKTIAAVSVDKHVSQKPAKLVLVCGKVGLFDIDRTYKRYIFVTEPSYTLPKHIRARSVCLESSGNFASQIIAPDTKNIIIDELYKAIHYDLCIA